MEFFRLLSALSFAADRHAGGRRKDILGTPYINHPIDVAEILANDGGVTDIDLLSAAVLHDTVEDSETTLDELTELFGFNVSSIVAEVTDDKSLPKYQRKRLQIDNAAGKSTAAKQLKIADKISNLRDINLDSPVGWDRDRKMEYIDWAEQVIQGCRGLNERLDRLFDAAVTDARRRLVRQ